MRTIFIILLLAFSSAKAQIPNGYYNSAQGLQGAALKTALHNIIDNHNGVSYNSLYNHFADFDTLNGFVWDVYSHNPDSTLPYTYHYIASDECGNYSGEGDCFNREHSWPQSWFNSANTPTSDMFHVYPTDGYVNGIRGNLPYGNVGVTNYVSANGSKRGSCTNLGYSGTVFEPIDAYKGDLARSYFYMSTRYFTEDASWDITPMTNKSEINLWAVAVLLQWHHQDTVSTKEILRNEGIFDVQNNRNPFIDHPAWADSIWAQLITKTTSIESNLATVIVYPNPANTFLNVSLNNIELTHNYTCKIVNSLGQIVVENKVYQPFETIDLNGVYNGVYTLIIETSKNNFYKKVIVK